MPDTEHEDDQHAVMRALGPLLSAIEPGPVLHLGRGEPMYAAACAERGFDVPVVAFSPDDVVESPGRNLGTAPARADRSGAAFVPEVASMHYALVVVEGVLSSLSPVEGDRLLALARRAARPAGVVCVTARTTRDRARAALHDTSQPIARDTFELDDGRTQRFLAPGELAMAFEGWSLLHVADPPGSEGGVAGARAVVIARRPSGGTLLA